jgi:hypothetical protein
MMLKLLCFNDAEKFNYFFFYFWLGLLFCRLLWSGLGELVSMMEWDPYYLIENLNGECESRSLEMIGAELSKEWREVHKARLCAVS